MSNYDFTKSPDGQEEIKDLIFLVDLTKSEAETINGGLSLSFDNPSKKANQKPDGTYGGKNIAPAWTAACYREFGPNARDPDSKMLQWCLKW